MLYNINDALNVAKNDKSYISAGINENLSLDSVRAEKSQNGSNFIEFKFVDDSGATLLHTEWEPTARPTDSAEAVKSRNDNQLSRILQLMLAFYSKEQLAANVSSFNNFEELMSWVKRGLDAADKTIKLRVKVVYNDKGFTSLPKYAKYTFIEPMTVEAKDSKIKHLQIDTFVRPTIVADNESVAGNTNPFVGASTTVSSTNLPF